MSLALPTSNSFCLITLYFPMLTAFGFFPQDTFILDSKAKTLKEATLLKAQVVGPKVENVASSLITFSLQMV